MKNVLAAHDLSGFGIASLTAVMPILSSMKLLTHPLPTAVLSTVTGVYSNYVIVDLTEQMDKTITHWINEGFTFNYIYSGFLGSAKQVDIILRAVDAFPDAEVVVDPAFADNGKIYATMGADMVDSMRRLVARADITTPNVTEAMFLLNKSAPPSSTTEAKQWAEELCGMGTKKAVITGCEAEGRAFIAICDSTHGNQLSIVDFDKIDVPLHGTGDIYTSVLLGKLAAGMGIVEAADFAAVYMSRLIRLTLDEADRIQDAKQRQDFIHLGLAIHLAHDFLK